MYYAYYLDVVYQDFTEAGRKHVSGFLVASVTNRGHQELALETPSHSVVNTLGLTPAPLEKKQINHNVCILQFVFIQTVYPIYHLYMVHQNNLLIFIAVQ